MPVKEYLEEWAECNEDSVLRSNNKGHRYQAKFQRTTKTIYFNHLFEKDDIAEMSIRELLFPKRESGGGGYLFHCYYDTSERRKQFHIDIKNALPTWFEEDAFPQKKYGMGKDKKSLRDVIDISVVLKKVAEKQITDVVLIWSGHSTTFFGSHDGDNEAYYKELVAKISLMDHVERIVVILSTCRCGNKTFDFPEDDENKLVKRLKIFPSSELRNSSELCSSSESSSSTAESSTTSSNVSYE